MKKKFVVLIVLLAGCVTLENVSDVNIEKNFPQNEIQKVLVLMFETSQLDKEKASSGLSTLVTTPDANTVLADIVARELAEWGRYVVLDRRAFKEGLRLMGLKKKDVLQKENYLNLGKSLGVDAVVVGEVERFGVSFRTLFTTFMDPVVAEVSFLVRCLDVATNETIWSFKVNGSSKGDERSLASKLVENAVKALKKEIK